MKDNLFSYPRVCYAAWSDEVAYRRKCASGGFVSLLSRYVIEQGGVVYGVRYNESWQAVYAKASSVEELEAFKGSKYTYVRIADTYQRIQEDLKTVPLLLFVGLPCQVAGLYQFLGCMPDNLLTCDLFCHGTPPGNYLSEEIAYLQRKHRLPQIDDVRFRGNDDCNYYLTLWYKDALLYKKKAQAQCYFSAFLDGLSLREACQTCAYAKVERVGDLSAGDFIGLGKEAPFDGPIRNTSVLLINRLKVSALLSSLLAAYPNLHLEERSLQEAVKWAPALQAHRKRHPKTSDFHRAVKKYGWPRASRAYQWRSIMKYYSKQLYLWCHHQAHLCKKWLLNSK